MKMLTLVVAIAFVLAIGTAASNDEDLVRTKDAPSVARDLVGTFLSEAEWRERVSAAHKRFQQWHEEHQEDAGMFLNNQLSAIALGASGGNVGRLKNTAVWMAMYQEFDEPLPSYVLDFSSRRTGLRSTAFLQTFRGRTRVFTSKQRLGNRL